MGSPKGVIYSPNGMPPWRIDREGATQLAVSRQRIVRDECPRAEYRGRRLFVPDEGTPYWTDRPGYPKLTDAELQIVFASRYRANGRFE